MFNVGRNICQPSIRHLAKLHIYTLPSTRVLVSLRLNISEFLIKMEM